MSRKHLIAVVGILLVFSVGLVAFYLFSDGLPDGLNRTVSDHGTGEQTEPVWTAPLNYGSDYASTMLMGIVGFFITLLVIIGVVKLRKSIKAD